MLGDELLVIFIARHGGNSGLVVGFYSTRFIAPGLAMMGCWPLVVPIIHHKTDIAEGKPHQWTERFCMSDTIKGHVNSCKYLRCLGANKSIFQLCNCVVGDGQSKMHII